MRIRHLMGMMFLLMSSVIASSHKDQKEVAVEKNEIDGMSALSKDTSVDDFKLIEDELRRNAAVREKGLTEQEKAENELSQLRDADKKAEAARLAKDENDTQIKRQREIAEREKNKDSLDKEDREARKKASRMKGITKDEMNWSGLE